MQQLYFVKKGILEWRDVPAPVLQHKQEAIVRPFAVAKCDLDDAYLFNPLPLKLRLGKLFNKVDPAYFSSFGKNFLQGPFPFGHECVAEVIEVGDDVKQIKPGDVVSVPFQISCGSCMNCSAGYTHACNNTPPISTFGFGKHLEFGGAASDFIKVPFADAMLIPIPPEIDALHLASLSDNIPDAYRAVGPHLENTSDKSVLILGGVAKSIGLYAVLLAKALGSPLIDYVDYDEVRTASASRLGANNVFASFSQISRKYDVVVDASSKKKGLDTAIKSLAKGGVCTAVGIYMRRTYFPFIDMYTNGGTFITGFANAQPYALKALDLIKEKKLDLSLVTSTLSTWENAIDAFLTKSTKVIVHRERKFVPEN